VALPLRTTNPVTILAPQARQDFVATNAVEHISTRALSYLRAGFPLHLRGPAGTGKTTLALHIAAQLGRPIVLIVGDEEFSTSNLIGEQQGYRYRRVVDRYIQSVVKIEEDAVKNWVDNRLTTACREGLTLVYDEFTRSRPEANNVLLSVLEERMLILPDGRGDPYVRVHPQFRAIFTSNPQEYAGVHHAQDALSDRLVTLEIDYYDRDTEIMITASRSGMSAEHTARIVDLVRDFRASGEYDQPPTLRACIMIAKVAMQQGCLPASSDAEFVMLCHDILESKKAFGMKSRDLRSQQRKLLTSLIERHCGSIRVLTRVTA
jgi:nitric oxide reductase NorQ protein